MRGMDKDQSEVKNQNIQSVFYQQHRRKPIIMLKNHLISSGEQYSFSNGVNTEEMKKEDDSSSMIVNEK